MQYSGRALYTLKHHPAESVTSDFFIADPVHYTNMMTKFLSVTQTEEAASCDCHKALALNINAADALFCCLCKDYLHNG